MNIGSLNGNMHDFSYNFRKYIIFGNEGNMLVVSVHYVRIPVNKFFVYFEQSVSVVSVIILVSLLELVDLLSDGVHI